MQVSLDWLADFTELPPLATLVDLLTRAGIEVEAVSNPAARVSGVVVAEVVTVAPHPNADRLRHCEVFDGVERFKVVCGAPNVEAGQKVALAKVEAANEAYEAE